MSTPADNPRHALRQSVYLILAVVSAGLMLGRIFAVDSVDMYGVEKDRMRAALAEKKKTLEAQQLPADQVREELKRAEEELEPKLRLRRPFLSANDRSRWCTARALVEEDLRVPGAPFAIDRVIQEKGWDTIDMVKHDGHLYSSKPPLFPTLLAGEYWVIYRLTGETLATQPYVIGRFMAVTSNVLPMLLYFWLLAKLVERFGRTDWAKVFVLAAAAFGTFLTTFAVVVNNHIPAAVCALIALYAAIRIWFDGERRWWYFALAGLSGAFMATDELPALSLFAALSLGLAWKAPRKTLLAYAPAALFVAAAFFATNWIAHQSLRPPYMHRSKTDVADNWYVYTYQHNGRQLHSYWEDPVGVDRGEPSAAAYALHLTVGHHGIISLTPLWIFSAAGVFLWLFQRDDRRLRELAILVGSITVVVVGFYMTLPQADRNYGGMTTGPRWVFWLAPLWLVTMLPALDAAAGRRWLKYPALAALALSTLSAAYATWNPWTHPWIYDFFTFLHWI
ncbi:MAG: hypothetical protein ACLQNE_29880 [Thermoguttaceae bacterium]